MFRLISYRFMKGLSFQNLNKPQVFQIVISDKQISFLFSYDMRCTKLQKSNNYWHISMEYLMFKTVVAAILIVQSSVKSKKYLLSFSFIGRKIRKKKICLSSYACWSGHPAQYTWNCICLPHFCSWKLAIEHIHRTQ